MGRAGIPPWCAPDLVDLDLLLDVNCAAEGARKESAFRKFDNVRSWREAAPGFGGSLPALKPLGAWT
jgi:hypothetical protein